MMRTLKFQNGQTLMEILVATAIAAFVLVAFLSAMISASRNLIFSKNQILATKYAQQLLEEARDRRESASDWTIFTSNCPDSFNSPPFSGGTVCDCGSVPNTCLVTATVSWTDSKGDHDSILTTSLTKWK